MRSFHCDGYSSTCSNTRRTARSRTSGECRVALFMAPSSQRMEPPGNPAWFNAHTAHGFVDGAYLRRVAEDAGKEWPDPHELLVWICRNSAILTGAFSEIFDAAVLMAGDADFVPAVRELGRRSAWLFWPPRGALCLAIFIEHAIASCRLIPCEAGIPSALGTIRRGPARAEPQPTLRDPKVARRADVSESTTS